MSYQSVIRFFRMILILAIQILILNHIHILGYITPLMIGYMIIPFHRGTGRITLLLWGFITGLLFDIFSNTAGMSSASLTLLAMAQPALLNVFTPRDAAEDYTPGFNTMGVGRYITYCLFCMFLVHALFYTLDAFTLHNWQLTLIAIAGGTLITTFLCVLA